VSEGGNGHYYERVYGGRLSTWPYARDAAASSSLLGVPGHLATVTSEAERQFITRHLEAQPDVFPFIHELWIGGQQSGSARTTTAGWSWVTGEPWGYTAWDSDEPNDFPTDWPTTSRRAGTPARSSTSACT
jgi:hypothetical protein